MARKLLCLQCDKKFSKLVIQHLELYESVKGKSNSQYQCDNCGEFIKEDDECFAACLLLNKNHPNYQFQKPDRWMKDFFKTK
jgi:hypothetical protein